LTIRKRIHVRGIVQGVGFRPFVYRLAQRLQLTGFVRNTPDSVWIEVEGPDSAVALLLHDLTQSPPPGAEIGEVSSVNLDLRGEEDFLIRESVERDFGAVLVSPDIATCEDCRREFADPDNRRFGYPFTNCTHCGPRYSIIEDVPYDRVATTMREFQMCARCQAEYSDPANRRFHAQPNACPDCGPKVLLMDSKGIALDAIQVGNGNTTRDLDAIREVRRLLKEGKIVGIKGLGGFHLACDAENDGAVRRLRDRKRRSDKPFALMAASVSSILNFCQVSDEECKCLQSARRPIVILERRGGSHISPAVAPGSHTLGVMLPYTPLHSLLFGESLDTSPAFIALVMTSGNLSEEPIVISDDEAISRLGPIAEVFLLHNRRIHMRVDDSVVRVVERKDRVLRRSRGYVPSAIDLGQTVGEVLACGAELKNTFCVTRGRYAFLSQHIGDLENYETLEFFEETLANFKKLFRISPNVIAHDLHPGYISTQYALEQGGNRRIGVQHHHAHVASCMAENGLNEKVIGVAFDGTGYGTDGKIWGGEFLVADLVGFERRAQLRYIPLAGGDTAIGQPWRSALSYLRETYGNELPDGLPIWGAVAERNRGLVWKMLEQNINTVETSSCGRLFDAIASILGLRHEINFEAQGAIELEMAARQGTGGVYPFQVEYSDPWQIDVRPMIESVVSEIQQSIDVGEIAARFHNTVAEIIAQVCWKLREQEKLDTVCLSGGTFQNVFLLERTLAALRENGFDVYLHAKVPPNDGGIALGQAVVANAMIQKEN
jgi:hydrogenase maturation protein HypF